MFHYNHFPVEKDIVAHILRNCTIHRFKGHWQELNCNVFLITTVLSSVSCAFQSLLASANMEMIACVL